MTEKDKEYYKKLLDDEIQFLRKKRAGRFRDTEKDRLRLAYSKAIISGLSTMLGTITKDDIEDIKADLERMDNLLKSRTN